jgi:hypothetical protein
MSNYHVNLAITKQKQIHQYGAGINRSRHFMSNESTGKRHDKLADANSSKFHEVHIFRGNQHLKSSFASDEQNNIHLWSSG